MQYKNLTLDQFQVDALASVDKNNSVVVSAPTGSGKTLIADYIIETELKKGSKVIYTAPIKALSNQKYREFSSQFGAENIGLLTGDVVINPQANILIMTTEIYRNMAITRDPSLDIVSYVVFDEIHYLNDIERGYVWEESIIFSKEKVRFLCLSATIPNAAQFADWISSIKKHQVDVIIHDKRNVPLHTKFFDSELGVTTLEDIKSIIDIPDYNYVMKKSKFRRPRVTPPNHIALIKEIKDKLPGFFFNFSRAECEKNAFELMKAKIFQPDPKIISYIREKLSDAPKEINNLRSTKLLKDILPHGIGVHHAGLIPIQKELVEELFGKGLLKVLYTTETFAVGINMPAKSVCFQSLRKFDGINFRNLNSKEFFQIAGRAGRRGIDKEGFVFIMLDRRDFDYQQIRKIVIKDTEPIKSQFKLSINTVLNLIKRHQRKEIDEILCKNFFTFQKHGHDFENKKDEIYYQFNKIERRLENLNYIKDGKLTKKGEFGAKIYADEIITTEVFCSDFYQDLSEIQITLLLAAIVFEAREKTKFFETHESASLSLLRKKIKAHEFIGKEKRFIHLKDLTCLIAPVFQEKTIFDVIKNTTLLEGDLIRFYRQIIDRIRQIRDATEDEKLKWMLKNCQDKIEACLRNIDQITAGYESSELLDF